MRPRRNDAYSIRRDDAGNLHKCHASDELDWMDYFDDLTRGRHELADVRLLRIHMRVTELGRALAREKSTMTDGTSVVDEIDRLYRAMTGHNEDTLARKELVRAIELTAMTMKRAGSMTDEQLNAVFRHYLHDDEIGDRLRRHVAEVALAVRLATRGRGRPKRGEPAGSKWAAFAEVVRLAGLSFVDEKTLEQMMKEDECIDITPLKWDENQ